MFENLDQRIQNFINTYKDSEFERPKISVFRRGEQVWGCRTFEDEFYRKPQYYTVLGEANVRADFWEIKDPTATAPNALIYYRPKKSLKIPFKKPIIEERFILSDRKIKCEQILELQVKNPNRPKEYLFSNHASVLKTLPDNLQGKLSPIYAFFNVS